MHASIQAALSAFDLAAQERRLLKIDFPMKMGQPAPSCWSIR